MIFLKPIIFSSHTTVYTDNRNSTFDSDVSHRIQRFKLILEEFDMSIKHMPGKLNVCSDGLSRLNMIKEADYKVLEMFDVEDLMDFEDNEVVERTNNSFTTSSLPINNNTLIDLIE